MDKDWYLRTKDLTERDQWRLLFEQEKEKRIEGRSIWLANQDIEKYATLLVPILYVLFDDLKVKSFVDVGCSDVVWQSKMDWTGIDYLGLDIVDSIIEENKNKYKNMRFECKNLIEDDCPMADVIFIRNVLLHTNLIGIKKILNNVKKSGSKYVMMSSLPAVKENLETSCIWATRRNLELEPFNLPEPIVYIPEILPSFIKKKAKNNYIGIWRVEDLPYYDLEVKND